MTKEELKRLVLKQIDLNKEAIISIGNDIFNHPELGFKEFRTFKLAADQLKVLGLSCEEGLAITGVKACAKAKKS